MELPFLCVTETAQFRFTAVVGPTDRRGNREETLPGYDRCFDARTTPTVIAIAIHEATFRVRSGSVVVSFCGFSTV